MNAAPQGLLAFRLTRSVSDVMVAAPEGFYDPQQQLWVDDGEGDPIEFCTGNCNPAVVTHCSRVCLCIAVSGSSLGRCVEV